MDFWGLLGLTSKRRINELEEKLSVAHSELVHCLNESNKVNKVALNDINLKSDELVVFKEQEQVIISQLLANQEAIIEKQKEFNLYFNQIQTNQLKLDMMIDQLRMFDIQMKNYGKEVESLVSMSAHNQNNITISLQQIQEFEVLTKQVSEDNHNQVISNVSELSDKVLEYSNIIEEVKSLNDLLRLSLLNSLSAVVESNEVT